MIIIPNQYFGIGDIIFTQTLVHELAQDNKVLWPVLPEFVNQLNHAYSEFIFVDCYKNPIIDSSRRGDYVWQDYRVLPLRFAQEQLKKPYKEVMRAKYDLYNMDWSRWKEKANYIRDHYKEESLHTTLVPKKDGVLIPYNLINNTFQSDAKGKLRLAINNGLHNVHMGVSEGYSLFDWSYLIEHATEIHTVSTSIIYLFELLDLKMPIHIYPRVPIERTLENIDYILTKDNYILHG